MAKRIIDEEMRFRIIINGNEAQKELFDLEKSTKSLVATNNKLRTQRQRLERQGKKNGTEWKKLTAQITANTATIQKNNAQMTKLENQLGVTGLTLTQLYRKAGQLRAALRHMIPGSESYIAYQTQLKQISGRITELNGKTRAAKMGLSSLADGFNKYAALGASFIATGTGIVLSLQKMIDYNGKLSDSQSDVQKTTQLNKKEVSELTKEFGLFKTRSARIELLKLAEEAGRLGITGKQNVAAFVKEANKIKVALGDDLSDEAIREVGKIVNIYGVGTETGKNFTGSLNALGSAINEVSSKGANTADFLVDYLKRMAGVAKSAKISAADNIGYAATFDELGQSVEVSATAMNKVFLDMFKNPGEYAEIAGKSVGEFSKLLETDSNKAMIMFLKGLNGNNAGLTKMSKKLDALGVDGARSSQALLALSANTKLLEERQTDANVAQSEAISLNKEYALKNNNLAGILDKIKKKIIGAFSSESVVSSLNNFVVFFAKFIGASEDADGKVTKLRNRLIALLKTVLVITTAIVSYNAAVKLTTLFTTGLNKATRLYILLQKASAISAGTLRSAQLLVSAGYNLITGNIVRASAAMRVFNTITKLNPLGLLLGALSTVTVAYLAFSEASEKAATKQSMLGDAIKQASIQTASAVSKVQSLQEVVEDETLSEEARLSAIEELNKIVPSYNENLDLSATAVAKGKEKLDLYIESLVKQAEAQYLADQIAIKSKELREKENSSLEEHSLWYDRLWNTIKSGGNIVAFNAAQTKSLNENRTKSIQITKDELEIAKQAYKDYLKLNPSSLKNFEDFIPKNDGDGDGDGDGDDNDNNNPNRSKKLFDLEREREEVEQLINDNAQAKALLVDDVFKRELQQLDIQHQEKVRQLRLQETTIAELKALQQKADKARNLGDTETADNYEAQMGVLMAKNTAINEQLQTLELTHQRNLGTIISDGFSNRLNTLTETFEREKITREEYQNNQLAALGDKEEAKKALQEQFNQENLEIELKHLQDVQAQAQQIFNSGQFEGFNLDLITDEQKQAIIDRLSEIGLSISEINLLLNQLQNGGGESIDSLDLGQAGKLDILGFSAEDWVESFKNLDTWKEKLATVAKVANALVTTWKMYDEFVSNNEAKRLEQFEVSNKKKQDILRSRLDNGLINQRQYNNAIEASNRSLDKKKAAIEYKQAKRKREITIAEIITTTALAVTTALTAGPFIGPILAGIVGALGAFQLGIALSQPLPAKGYQDGFYPVQREQDGKIFNARNGGFSRSGIVSEPTLFLAGEEGSNRPEMIINGTDYNNFTPEFKGSLNREIARVKGYQDGFYQSSTSTVQNSQELFADNENITTTDQSMLMNVIGRNTEVMQYLIDNGVIAYMSRDMENTQKLKEDLDRLQKYKDKARINGS